MEKLNTLLWLRCSLVSLLLKPIRNNASPVKVGKYLLISEIKKHHSTSYGVGVYKSGSQKFFIKTWTGKFKDFEYFSLLNEFKVSQSLYTLINKLGNPHHVYLPKPIEIKRSQYSVSVVYEFISGHTLDHYSTQTQAQTIATVISSLDSLSFRLTSKDKHTFHSRPLLWYVAILPIRLSVIDGNLFTRIKKMLHATLLLINVKNSTSLTLAHRDLTPENIMLTKSGRIIILDCEQVCLTVPNYDWHILHINPQTKKILKYLPKHQVSNRLLGLYSLHSLASPGLPEFHRYYSSFTKYL